MNNNEIFLGFLFYGSATLIPIIAILTGELLSPYWDNLDFISNVIMGIGICLIVIRLSGFKIILEKT